MKTTEQLEAENQILKQRIEHLEADIKDIRSVLEGHAAHHVKLLDTREERGWQLRNNLIAAAIAIVGTAIFIPLLQLWLPVPPPGKENNVPTPENNSWFGS